LAIGEDVAVDEGSRAPEQALGKRQRTAGSRRTLDDAVVEKKPAGPQQAVRLREVAVEPGAADMLDHAHARDLVECRCRLQLAVVPHRNPATLLEARGGDPLPCQRRL